MRRFGTAFSALGLFIAPAFAQPPDSLPGCTYNATPPSLSDKQTTTWQCDINGKLLLGGNAANAITALTGDVTAAGPGSAAATLATVNAGSGAVGSSTAIPVLTTNAKGLVTAQTTAAVVAPAGTLTGTVLASNVVTSSLTSAAGGTFGSNAFNSTGYLPLVGGTLTGALLFTDNSFDIGAAGATRPRAGYFGTSVTIGAGSAITSSGAGGALGTNAFTSTSYLPLAGGTLTGALLFTDNSFDIGAAGATRPRAGYFGTSVTIGAGSAITSSGPGGALASGAYATAVTAANPTASAGATAINGSAATFMRSDAAPAIAKASSSVFGIVEVDNSTITAAAGVITTANTTVGGVTCTPGSSCSPAVTNAIITSSRDLTVATGSVAYTGLGFRPSSCHVQAAVNASASYMSWGFSSTANLTGRDLYLTNLTFSAQNHFIDLLDATGTNSQTASVASYDNDGLTLSWTKTGTPTGTAQLAFLCYK